MLDVHSGHQQCEGNNCLFVLIYLYFIQCQFADVHRQFYGAVEAEEKCMMIEAAAYNEQRRVSLKIEYLGKIETENRNVFDPLIKSGFFGSNHAGCKSEFVGTESQ